MNCSFNQNSQKLSKSKPSKSDRKKVKKAVVKYYGGNYASDIVKKLAESGVTVEKQDIYNYFAYGYGPYAGQILEACYLIIDEAKIEAHLRAERLNGNPIMQKSAGLSQ